MVMWLFSFTGHFWQKEAFKIPFAIEFLLVMQSHLVMSRWPRKPSRSLLRGKSSLPNQNVLQHCFCKSGYKTFVNTFLLLTAFTVECFFALLYVNILIIWFSAVFANKHCIFRALPMVGFFRYLKHLIPPENEQKFIRGRLPPDEF